jgi:hypothetical protein
MIHAYRFGCNVGPLRQMGGVMSRLCIIPYKRVCIDFTDDMTFLCSCLLQDLHAEQIC